MYTRVCCMDMGRNIFGTCYGDSQLMDIARSSVASKSLQYRPSTRNSYIFNSFCILVFYISLVSWIILHKNFCYLLPCGPQTTEVHLQPPIWKQNVFLPPIMNTRHLRHIPYAMIDDDGSLSPGRRHRSHSNKEKNLHQNNKSIFVLFSDWVWKTIKDIL